jgi:histone deacetylase 1/2
MEIPAGFAIINSKLTFIGEGVKNTDKTYVLRLRKNMYGLKQAGNNWYKHLMDDLLQHGFRQSRVDKCLFIRHDCILLLYVDDCLLFSPSAATLASVTQHLSTVFNITSEEDVGAYLGIDISRTADGHLLLCQPGLIDKVINICGLENESNAHHTPATEILHRADPTDPPRQLSWSFRQVIGILNYIAATSRPDISFAVHQCARFCSTPTRKHELAVKCIIRYLKGTRDKGYILKPTGTIDCYVDADFAGAWTFNTSDDPSSVKSRTGYILTYSGCPILWSSKLQSEIALSTTEAEYIALSTSLCNLIPMRTILQELGPIFQISPKAAKTHSTVFEDNKGCIDLIAAPTMRPRTRHIAIKYHHFREQVCNGNIHIQWISTENQLADIFTKPLTAQKFTNLRRTLLGW